MHQSTQPLAHAYWRWRAHYLERREDYASYENETQFTARIGRLIEHTYGRTPTHELDLGKLDEMVSQMSRGGWKRDGYKAKPWNVTTINKALGLIRQFIIWGGDQQLIEAGRAYFLADNIPYAKAGRKGVKPKQQRKAIAVDNVFKLQPYYTPTLWGMVQFQYYGGMRPGDVCRATWQQIDTSGELWVYTPDTHKTDHLGLKLFYLLGPKAQAALQRFAGLPPTRPLFNLCAHRRERQRMKAGMDPLAIEPTSYGSEQGFFASKQYSRAITGTISLARHYEVEVENWTPYQLRHACATEVNQEFGLAHAAAVLGNTKDVVKDYVHEVERRILDYKQQVAKGR